MLSGPHDLDGSRVDSNFLTPSTEIGTLSNCVMGSPEHSGILDRFSLVRLKLFVKDLSLVFRMVHK